MMWLAAQNRRRKEADMLRQEEQRLVDTYGEDVARSIDDEELTLAREASAEWRDGLCACEGTYTDPAYTHTEFLCEVLQPDVLLVEIVQSPFTKRALEGTLPAKEFRP